MSGQSAGAALLAMIGKRVIIEAADGWNTNGWLTDVLWEPGGPTPPLLSLDNGATLINVANVISVAIAARQN